MDERRDLNPRPPGEEPGYRPDGSRDFRLRLIACKDIDQTKVQIQSAEDRKIYLESQLATVKPDTPMINSTGERVLDPESRLRELEVKLCDLQSKFSSNYPDVIKCKREMAELRKMTGAAGGSPSVQRQKLTNLKAELAEKQGHYSDQHPEIIKLKKEIA